MLALAKLYVVLPEICLNFRHLFGHLLLDKLNLLHIIQLHWFAGSRLNFDSNFDRLWLLSKVLLFEKQLFVRL